MKYLMLLSTVLSLNSYALTYNVGTYVGTLRVGNNETGKACSVEVVSKSVSSQGSGCFKFVVTSKELEIKNMEFEMRYDTLKGNVKSCSDRVYADHIESKAKAYMVEYDDGKSVFINRMNFILNHTVLNCHDLVQVK